MPEDKILDCIKNNPPEALVPLSKAFGSMVYILCYHVFKNLPQDEDCEVDQDLIVEAGLSFICEYISRDAVKYMEYDCVEDAINTYVASSQWLAELYVTYRSEILKYS